jgi:8-oxo-dGTP diphosphatase
MNIRVGMNPQRGRYYKPRPGVYAILALGSDVLLTHQTEPWPEFQLPGGGVDPGEQPLAALHREVREETGWSISAPRRLGMFRRFTYMPEYDLWAEKLCTVYCARPVRPITAPLEAGHSAVWMAASEAVELLGNDGDARFLQEFITRGGPW